MDRCCTTEQLRDAKIFQFLGANATHTATGGATYDDSLVECEHGAIYTLFTLEHWDEDRTEEVSCELATLDELKKAVLKEQSIIKDLYDDLSGEGLMNTQCQNCFQCFKGYIYETCSCGKPMGISMEMYKSWFYKVNRQLEGIRHGYPKLYTNSMNVHVVDDIKIRIDDFWKLDFKKAKIGYTFSESDAPAVERPYGHVSDFAQVKGKINGVKLTAEYKEGKIEVRVTTLTGRSDLGTFTRGGEVLYQTDNLWDFGKYIKGLDGP